MFILLVLLRVSCISRATGGAHSCAGGRQLPPTAPAKGERVREGERESERENGATAEQGNISAEVRERLCMQNAAKSAVAPSVHSMRRV